MNKFLIGFLIMIMTGCVVKHQHITQPILPRNVISVNYLDNQENIINLTNSVVGLVTPGEASFLPYCSAFFIRPTHIATAAHCLRTEDLVGSGHTPGIVGQTVHFSTNKQWRDGESTNNIASYRASIVSIDSDNDVAILRSLDFTSSYSLQINTTVPVVGSSVYAMGFPGGTPWVFSNGIVTKLDFDSSGMLIEIMASASIFFGSSGGPLVNNEGNIIGLSRAILFRQATFGVFTPARRLVAIRGNLT